MVVTVPTFRAGQAEMSYILDALRKSETERRQGRVPDLGQQVQLIHKPKKRSSALVLWIIVALVLNAIVLAVIFWPGQPFRGDAESPREPESEPDQAAPVQTQEPAPGAPEDPPETPVQSVAPVPEPIPEPALDPEPVSLERPTIIVPSPSSQQSGQPSPRSSVSEESVGQVPHLVEMPLEFQKMIPDMVFNSHIYASEPSSRRVMINSNYLKAGDSFSGIRVERITEEGVVLSKNNRSFRVGSMRDWVTPD